MRKNDKKRMLVKSIHFTEEMMNDLDKIASKKGLGISSLIRMALIEWLHEYKDENKGDKK